MESNEVIFGGNISSGHLTTIGNIKFTPREVDVIACLLNARRTSQIASILSIAPRTITTHFRNIMLKIGCNSQDGIITFMEKSKTLPFLREYYEKLMVQFSFEKGLKELSKHKKELVLRGPIALVIDPSLKGLSMSQLPYHLKQAGIPSSLSALDNAQGEQAIPSQDRILFCLIETQDIPVKLASTFKVLELQNQMDYYLLVVELFKKLFPTLNIEKIFTNFKEQYTGMSTPKPATSCLSLNYSSPSVKLENLPSKEQEVEIRSDLILPTETTFLHRPNLEDQIHKKLSGSARIQTVALIGIGGSGKTTLARSYARGKSTAVLWEFNAETEATIKNSFENLAQALAKTTEDQDLLGRIQNTQDPDLKDEKILQFTKERLRAQAPWFFIFDNVGSFINIQKYFPQDSATWGKGEIILTSRNSNIQSNTYIDNFIFIGELDTEEKLDLFMKISQHGNPLSESLSQGEELDKFLSHIPPFPLDISIAACYVKTTRIPYEGYLQSLTQYDKEFVSTQQILLKEVRDYTKTRYGIITLSLDHILQSHPNFKNLLLLISLLNSQNIPRELLDKYEAASIVDNFIYNLKRYSLITLERLFLSSVPPVFSIHRSTQTIMLVYLIKILNLEKNKYLTECIGKIFSDYVAQVLDREDRLCKNILIGHCATFLSHSRYLTSFTKACIGSELGDLYRDLGNYKKAKKLYEESIRMYRNSPYDRHPCFARTLAGLGSVYREQGYYDRAEKPFEESIKIYKENSYEDHPWFAWTLTGLGNVYRDMENCEKAEQFYKRSLAVYRKNSYGNHPWVAQVLACQGSAYKDLGRYEKARQVYEKALTYYKNDCSHDYFWIGCLLADLGDVYRELGNYKKARKCLEESLSLYKNNGPDYHPWIACSLEKLGKIYQESGEYRKAEKVLKESLNINRKTCRENHPWIAQTLCALGDLYIHLSQYEKAKKFLSCALKIYEAINGKERVDAARVLMSLGVLYGLESNSHSAEKFLLEALSVFQQHNHVHAFLCLEKLSDFYLQRSEHENEKKLSHLLRTKAPVLLEEALETLKAHFPQNSPHIQRVQTKTALRARLSDVALA